MVSCERHGVNMLYEVILEVCIKQPWNPSGILLTDQKYFFFTISKVFSRKSSGQETPCWKFQEICIHGGIPRGFTKLASMSLKMVMAMMLAMAVTIHSHHALTKDGLKIDCQSWSIIFWAHASMICQIPASSWAERARHI